MPLKNLKYFIILAVFFTLHSKTTLLDSEAVKNIAARNAYDLLTKISTVHGLSCGIEGQPMMLKRIGKASSEILLFIDEVYYGKRIADLSFLSVDQINNIVVDDRSVENSGITVKIYTKTFNSDIPVSEVKYRDAFFNYRDLTADIYQHVTDDFSFLISGEIFNWKDNRDKYDDFSFPYEKQNYRLKLLLPELKLTKPSLDITYTKDDKFLLAHDSSHVKSDLLRSAVYFDNRYSNEITNRLTAVHLHETDGNTTNYFSLYNISTFTDSLNRLEGKIGFNAQPGNGSLTYLRADYNRTAVINYGLIGYFSVSNDAENIMSTHLDLSKDLGFAEFETTHGYFSDDTNEQKYALVENLFSVKKSLAYDNFRFSFGTGFDRFDHKNDHNDFYRLEFGTDYKSKIRFSNEYLRSASGKISDTVFLNNLSALTFSDKYFNEKLTVNLAFLHRYSEYLIGNNMNYMNNLSFNFRARIVNFEFFFGSDNFLKDRYEFNDNIYEVNRHYKYRTIDGFDMRTMDEIWGIRWIFYR